MSATQSNANISRRDFLSLISKVLLTASGLLGLGGLVRFFEPPAEETQPTAFEIGEIDNYPLGSRTLIANARAILLHTPQGYRTLSLICPHLGCLVTYDGDGFTCPCHGSRFDLDGSLANGPADRDLESLKVETNPSGDLVVYMD